MDRGLLLNYRAKFKTRNDARFTYMHFIAARSFTLNKLTHTLLDTENNHTGLDLAS